MIIKGTTSWNMKWGLSSMGSTLMWCHRKNTLYKSSKDKDALRTMGRFAKIKRFEQKWGRTIILRHDNDLICQVGVLKRQDFKYRNAKAERDKKIDLMEELLGYSHLCLKNDRWSPCAVLSCSGSSGLILSDPPLSDTTVCSRRYYK